MFWSVMTIVSILAAIAFGWVTFHTTSERITIAFEYGRIRPVIAWLREAAGHLREKRRERLEHSQE